MPELRFPAARPPRSIYCKPPPTAVMRRVLETEPVHAADVADMLSLEATIHESLTGRAADPAGYAKLSGRRSEAIKIIRIRPLCAPTLRASRPACTACAGADVHQH